MEEGSSSSKRARGHTKFFLRPEYKEWYMERKDNQLVVEKSINAKLSDELGVRLAFAKLSWANIIDIQGMYYPKLVKEFYANIDNKQSDLRDSITTHLRGRKIVVTLNMLSAMIGCPNSGRPFAMSGKKHLYDPSFKSLDACDRLGIEAENRRHGQVTKAAVYSYSLAPLLKVALFLIYHNVIPAKNTNEVRYSDIYLLDQMIRTDEVPLINLPEIIMGQMRDIVRDTGKRRAFIFPILITQIALKAGVEISTDDMAVGPRDSDHLVVSQLSKLRIRRDPATGLYSSLGKKGQGAEEQQEERGDRAPPPLASQVGGGGNAQLDAIHDLVLGLTTSMANMDAKFGERFDRLEQWGTTVDDRLANIEDDLASIRSAVRRGQPPPSGAPGPSHH